MNREDHGQTNTSQTIEQALEPTGIVGISSPVRGRQGEFPGLQLELIQKGRTLASSGKSRQDGIEHDVPDDVNAPCHSLGGQLFRGDLGGTEEKF